MQPEQEAENIVNLARHDKLRVLDILERQFNVLHGRAQVLLSLAGVVITVTGFSGRIIAATSRPAQLLIVAGLFTVLASAVWLYSRVMRIRWLTGEITDDLQSAVIAIIRQRNCKTAAYTLGGKILCLGLVLYCAAIAIMLLYPQTQSIAAR